MNAMPITGITLPRSVITWKVAIGANGTRRCGKYCLLIKFARDANGAVGLPKGTSGDTRAVV